MRRLAMVILWPSFLVAALAEGLFFSLFDPADLPLDSMAMTMSPLGAYTLGFLLFWLFCALAALLSHYVACVPAERPPPF